MGNKIRSPLILLLAIMLALPVAQAAEDKVAFLSVKLGDNPSFKVRLKAAVLLGRMKDARAVRPLCDALEDDNYVVRGAAARALGNLGHPMAVGTKSPSSARRSGGRWRTWPARSRSTTSSPP